MKFYRVWTKDGDVWEEFGSLKRAEKEYDYQVKAGKKVVLDQWTGEKYDGDWDGDYEKTLKTNENIAESSTSGISAEMVQYYHERTNKHIKLVQRAASKIEQAFPEEFKGLNEKVKFHDALKFQEPEYTSYIVLTWQYKCKDAGIKFDVNEDMQNRIHAATLHHVLHSDHHPEYWNKEEANISKEDRDRSNKVLDVPKMPKIAIAETIADWQAMSEERKTNTCREWYNSVRGKRWNFTADQDNLIDRLIKVFEDVSENVEDIQDLIDVQKADPASKTDPYMQGLTNGLIVAQAVAQDRPLEDDELITFDKHLGEEWHDHPDPSGFLAAAYETHNSALQEDWKTSLTAAALAGTLFAVPPQAGAKTAIDAGHGGRDPGAVRGETYEKNINMVYAKALQDALPGSIATKEGDVYVSIGQRSSIANAGNADVFISFHTNSTADVITSASGVKVLYWSSSSKGKILAEELADALDGKIVPIKSADRGAGLLSGTKMPAVIVELGFINNPEDLKLLQSKEHIDSVTRSIVSVLKKLGYEKTEESNNQLYSKNRVDTLDYNRFTDAIMPILNETTIVEEVDGWELDIPGITRYIPKQYSFTHASSKEAAMSNVVFKVAQDFGYKGWKFTDGKFSAMIVPQYAKLIVKYLKDNPNIWTARRIEER